MRTVFIWCIFSITINNCIVNAQDKFTISGIVTEEKSNETLIGVNIILPELKTGDS